jgi:hypothetical protein
MLLPNQMVSKPVKKYLVVYGTPNFTATFILA